MGQAMRKVMYGELEYLESEIQAACKREFVAGEVYAMAGGTARHNRISLNVATRLDAATAEHNNPWPIWRWIDQRIEPSLALTPTTSWAPWPNTNCPSPSSSR